MIMDEILPRLAIIERLVHLGVHSLRLSDWRCSHAPDRLVSHMCRGQRALLFTLARAQLVRWDVSVVVPVHCVDDFEISRDFALDSLVCLAFRSTLTVKFMASLLDVVNRAANDLNLLVLGEPLIHIDVLVAGAEAAGLCILARLELLPANAIIHRLLLLQQNFGSIFDHITLILFLKLLIYLFIFKPR